MMMLRTARVREARSSRSRSARARSVVGVDVHALGPHGNARRGRTQRERARRPDRDGERRAGSIELDREIADHIADRIADRELGQLPHAHTSHRRFRGPRSAAATTSAHSACSTAPSGLGAEISVGPPSNRCAIRRTLALAPSSSSEHPAIRSSQRAANGSRSAAVIARARVGPPTSAAVRRPKAPVTSSQRATTEIHATSSRAT